MHDSMVVNVLTVLVLGLNLLEAPKPTVATVSTRAAGDSFWVVGQWTAGGAPDSALTRRILTLAGGKADTAYHRLPGAVKRDSFKLKNPLPGDTARGSFGVRSKWVNGRASAWASKPWTYTIAIPAPQIEMVDAKPDTVALKVTVPGQPVGRESIQQFCGFVVFKGTGHVAQRGRYKAACDSIYTRTIPAAKRVVTVAEQIKADSVCVVWQATGGTIEPETCPPGGLSFRSDTIVIHLLPRDPEQARPAKPGSIRAVS